MPEDMVQQFNRRMFEIQAEHERAERVDAAYSGALTPEEREWLAIWDDGSFACPKESDGCNETCRPQHVGLTACVEQILASRATAPAPACQHDPSYSRSECGLCGDQDAWCRHCGVLMCGCNPLIDPLSRPGGAADTEAGGQP